MNRLGEIKINYYICIIDGMFCGVNKKKERTTSDSYKGITPSVSVMNHQHNKGKKNILYKQEKYLFFNNLDYLYITNLICN